MEKIYDKTKSYPCMPQIAGDSAISEPKFSDYSKVTSDKTLTGGLPILDQKLMYKTSSEAAQQMCLQDWVIDTVDKQGRMSLRPIVVSEGRESTARISSGYFLDSNQNPKSANVKPIPRISQLNGLKFVRKSDL